MCSTCVLRLLLSLAPAGSRALLHWEMPKRWVQFALGLSLFVVVVVAASAFMDEPLRAYVEQRMNRSLKGYAVRIGVLDFHPIGFSVDLEDVEVVRTDEPDPPMATIPRWTARLHWKALLSGRVVNDHYIERPRLHITRRLAKKKPVMTGRWEIEGGRMRWRASIRSKSIRSGLPMRADLHR